MLAHARTPCVLIADVDPTNCRVFETKLARNNQFHVISVTSGHEAIQAALRNNFDVILWDLRHSDALLPRLQALCPYAVVLLMTTDDRFRLPEEWHLLEIVDTLVKPFSLDTMVEKIHLALARGPVLEKKAFHFEPVRVGQSLTLQWDNEECTTRVLECCQDTFLVVAGARVHAPEQLPEGQRITVQFNGEDALYHFRSRMVRAYSAPLTRWELQKPAAIQRRQRRRYPRFPMRVPVQIRVPAEGSTPVSAPLILSEALPVWEGETANIGLGGCAIVCSSALPAGTNVLFQCASGDRTLIQGRGRILRSDPLPVSDAPQYLLAIQFDALSPGTRRALRGLLHRQEGGPENR
ncbi:MAG: PilZ domain-containing protein [Chloroherpetonaceae bacterium]|nr:PilZ domain-containing protein [Chthonomonadaceae bacterium]MDW8208317.1 PilZ domain-containing protein [Chloroherpetonaceae bacterium]